MLVCGFSNAFHNCSRVVASGSTFLRRLPSAVNANSSLAYVPTIKQLTITTEHNDWSSFYRLSVVCRLYKVIFQIYSELSMPDFLINNHASCMTFCSHVLLNLCHVCVYVFVYVCACGQIRPPLLHYNFNRLDDATYILRSGPLTIFVCLPAIVFFCKCLILTLFCNNIIILQPAGIHKT